MHFYESVHGRDWSHTLIPSISPYDQTSSHSIDLSSPNLLEDVFQSDHSALSGPLLQDQGFSAHRSDTSLPLNVDFTCIRPVYKPGRMTSHDNMCIPSSFPPLLQDHVHTSSSQPCTNRIEVGLFSDYQAKLGLQSKISASNIQGEISQSIKRESALPSEQSLNPDADFLQQGVLRRLLLPGCEDSLSNFQLFN